MKTIRPMVFFPPFLLCLAFVALQFNSEQRFNEALTQANAWVTTRFGWLVSLTSLGLVLLCGVICASSFGRTVLGGSGAKRLLTPWQMFAVVLTTNIGAGILFWGVFEPTWHLSHPPGGIAPNSPEAARFAMSTVLLHWSLTPYAIPSVVGLMFGFAHYNMRRPFSLGAPLAPVLGESQAAGGVGQAIDAVCLYCLVAAICAALAGSAQLLAGGFHDLFGIEGKPGAPLLGAVIAAIMVTAVLAAISGVTKGIRWLANVNTYLLVAFIAMVLFAGPTRFILNLAVEGLGQFIGQYPQKVLNTGAAQQDTWASNWTQMYFSAFFAWAPIMGVFLGRIARGYSVRAFLVFNVALPSIFTGLWMAVICGSVVDLDMLHGANLAASLDGDNPTLVLYAFLDRLGWAGFLVPLLLITAFISFVTTADGCTDAMSNISTRGITDEDSESSMIVKIAWGALIGVLCWIVVTQFRLDGIRKLSNLGGFPALFLCIGIAAGAIKVLANPARYDTFHPDHADATRNHPTQEIEP